MLKISNLKLPIGFTEGQIKAAAAEKLRARPEVIESVSLVRLSVDARDKSSVHYSAAVKA